MTRPLLSRRQFFCAATAATALGAANYSKADPVILEPKPSFEQFSFACDGRTAKIYSSAITEQINILQISDSHLYLEDDRDKEFQEFSARMAKAYNHTKRFSDGKDTNPTEMFAEIAQNVKRQDYDALALTGDIVSFPSQLAVEFVKEKLESTETPYYYTCGNHDWHYEGLPGTEKELRDEWIEKRLKPLYPDGVDPLAYSRVVKGVNLLFIDDSTNEILPKQLDFLKKELAKELPTLVFLHIPLFAPERDLDYAIGHPDFNAEHDRYWESERRPRWSAEGHTSVTYEFRDAIINAPNTLGVFAGHVHGTSLDIINGTPSNVVRAAYDGSTLRIELRPFPKRPTPRDRVMNNVNAK